MKNKENLSENLIFSGAEMDASLEEINVICASYWAKLLELCDEYLIDFNNLQIILKSNNVEMAEMLELLRKSRMNISSNDHFPDNDSETDFFADITEVDLDMVENDEFDNWLKEKAKPEIDYDFDDDTPTFPDMPRFVAKKPELVPTNLVKNSPTLNVATQKIIFNDYIDLLEEIKESKRIFDTLKVALLTRAKIKNLAVDLLELEFRRIMDYPIKRIKDRRFYKSNDLN